MSEKFKKNAEKRLINVLKKIEEKKRVLENINRIN